MVYAIEKDEASLKCAKHNAQIYGVEDRISWYLGDFAEVLQTNMRELGPHSIIFASPPWGGEVRCTVPRVYVDKSRAGLSIRFDF